MRSCPNCGKEYEEDKKYCSGCGAIFSDQRQPAALICGKCGASNNFDFRFCRKCGNELAAKECSTTRSASEETLSADRKERDSDESSQAGHNTVFSPQTGSCPESEDSTRKAGNQLGDLNGEELFEESLRMILMDRGTPEERIDLISKALSHGLPLDAEVKAHAFIGSELFNVGADDEAIHHYEQSLKLGSNQGPMPEDDSMLLLCRKLCLKYVLIARKTEENQKSQECLAFLESKCAALKDLSSPVLYVELATLLANQGDIHKASTYFEKAARCPVVDEMDEKAKQFARESLLKIENKPKITDDQSTECLQSDKGAAARERVASVDDRPSKDDYFENDMPTPYAAERMDTIVPDGQETVPPINVQAPSQSQTVETQSVSSEASSQVIVVSPSLTKRKIVVVFFIGFFTTLLLLAGAGGLWFWKQHKTALQEKLEAKEQTQENPVTVPETPKNVLEAEQLTRTKAASIVDGKQESSIEPNKSAKPAKKRAGKKRTKPVQSPGTTPPQTSPSPVPEEVSRKSTPTEKRSGNWLLDIMNRTPEGGRPDIPDPGRGY